MDMNDLCMCVCVCVVSFLKNCQSDKCLQQETEREREGGRDGKRERESK